MENSNMDKDINVTTEEQEQAVNKIEVSEERKKKTLKLAKIAGYIGCILILAPFFITGFGFNWFWYLVILGVAFFTLVMFCTKGKDISEYSKVKKTLIGFLVVGCIMYLWGPLNPENEPFESRYGNIINSSSNNDNTCLTCPDDNHPHMIDLGLPSGTKWACCNVGASSPKDYGGYYAWGEINEKTAYNWNTYIHSVDSKKTCHNLGNDIAGTRYDVAHVKWGGGWRIPTLTQIQELIDNTTSEWTSENGIAGIKFTGSNGNTIFLPAAGRRGLEPDLTGSLGYYWSSTPREYGECYAYDLYFHLYGARWNYDDYRYYGLSVRPVAP